MGGWEGCAGVLAPLCEVWLLVEPMARATRALDGAESSLSFTPCTNPASLPPVVNLQAWQRTLRWGGCRWSGAARSWVPSSSRSTTGTCWRHVSSFVHGFMCFLWEAVFQQKCGWDLLAAREWRRVGEHQLSWGLGCQLCAVAVCCKCHSTQAWIAAGQVS